jgi:hypothetical protein
VGVVAVENADAVESADTVVDHTKWTLEMKTSAVGEVAVDF